jgi:DNA-binding NarL/FixJ family response regulator
VATAAHESLVRKGWAAIAAADWEQARSCFEQASQTDESAEVLDGLGRALHFQGEYKRAIEVTERAFLAYVDAGKPVAAADGARWLAFLHGTINANWAAASGWMARAASLLADRDECAGHGWLTLDSAVFSDDPAERERLAAAALAIARRFGDRDLEYDALALLGEAKVAGGHVAEGMKFVDQAMTAVSSGEVADVVAMSDIFCRLLGVCERVLDIARAEQWMVLVGNFSAWSAFVSPTCRAHYGGILVAVGRWTEAEEELLASIRAFESSYRGMRGSPLVKLGDLRVRQGRLDEARRLFEGNEHHPVARRALATVALATGEAALAEDLARLCLDSDPPSEPGCAPAVDLIVQARLARGDVAGARETAAKLEALAGGSRDELAAAFSDLAGGRVHAAAGDEHASSLFQSALRRFAALELPLEAGRAQLELARVLAADAPEAATGEARAALKTFERLGATADADAAAGLLRELGAGGRAWPKGFGELTKRETEVLSLLAAGCSNADIAQRLYISRRTAEHHVASILSKLGLRSRAEAAAYAVREQVADQ